MTGEFERKVLAGGWAFAEAPRWYRGLLWLSDMLGGRVLTIDSFGGVEVFCEVDSPMGLGWLPDGRLLIVSMGKWGIYVCDGGTVRQYADLSSVCVGPPNDMVVDQMGRAYVGNMGARGFLQGEPPQPADLVLIDTNRNPSVVASDLMFANGMVITPDANTLIVAETFGHRLTAFTVNVGDGSLSDRRTFADLGERTPDGIALDSEGAIWVASMETGEFLRVKEGGEVTNVIDLDGRHAAACAIGGSKGTTLFMVTLENAEGVTDPTEGIRRGDSIAHVETTVIPVRGADSVS